MGRGSAKRRTNAGGHPDLSRSIGGNDEGNASISSDDDPSHLGSKLQIPRGLHLQNKMPLKPAKAFPTFSRTSSSSREILRQEANVPNLVSEAKYAQGDCSVGSSRRQKMRHGPSLPAESLSVTLPAAAYHREAESTSRKSRGLSIPLFSSKSKNGPNPPSDREQRASPDDGFRGKPWISAAANRFVREEKMRHRQLLAAKGGDGCGPSDFCSSSEDEGYNKAGRWDGKKGRKKSHPCHVKGKANGRRNAKWQWCEASH